MAAAAEPPGYNLKSLQLSVSYCGSDDEMKSVKLSFPAGQPIYILKQQFIKTVLLNDVVGVCLEDQKVASLMAKKIECGKNGLVGKFWDELFTFVFDETVLENEATPLGLGMVDGDNIALSRKNELSRYEKDMQMFIESEPEDTLKDHSGIVLDRDSVVRSSLKMLNKRNAVHAELVRLSKRKMQQMSGGLNMVVGEPGGLPLLLKDTEPGPATPDPRLVRRAEMENCKIALMCSIYSSMQLYDMESDGFPCVTPMDDVNNINSRVCEQPGAEPYSSQAECVAELREALERYRQTFLCKGKMTD